MVKECPGTTVDGCSVCVIARAGHRVKVARTFFSSHRRLLNFLLFTHKGRKKAWRMHGLKPPTSGLSIKLLDLSLHSCFRLTMGQDLAPSSQMQLADLCGGEDLRAASRRNLIDLKSAQWHLEHVSHSKAPVKLTANAYITLPTTMQGLASNSAACISSWKHFHTASVHEAYEPALKRLAVIVARIACAGMNNVSLSPVRTDVRTKGLESRKSKG